MKKWLSDYSHAIERFDDMLEILLQLNRRKILQVLSVDDHATLLEIHNTSKLGAVIKIINKPSRNTKTKMIEH